MKWSASFTDSTLFEAISHFYFFFSCETESKRTQDVLNSLVEKHAIKNPRYLNLCVEHVKAVRNKLSLLDPKDSLSKVCLVLHPCFFASFVFFEQKERKWKLPADFWWCSLLFLSSFLSSDAFSVVCYFTVISRCLYFFLGLALHDWIHETGDIVAEKEGKSKEKSMKSQEI